MVIEPEVLAAYDEMNELAKTMEYEPYAACVMAMYDTNPVNDMILRGLFVQAAAGVVGSIFLVIFTFWMTFF